MDYLWIVSIAVVLLTIWFLWGMASRSAPIVYLSEDWYLYLGEDTLWINSRTGETLTARELANRYPHAKGIVASRFEVKREDEEL